MGEGENASCHFICHIHEMRKHDQNATNLKGATVISKASEVSVKSIKKPDPSFISETVNSETSMKFNFNETVINQLANEVSNILSNNE